MAIVLKYGAPGQILQTGFAAGVGSRKNKQQEDLLDIWQQQQAQAFQGQQAELGRQQQVGLQQQAQQFAAGQNKFNLDFRARQDRLDDVARENLADRAIDARAKESVKDDQRRFNQETYFRLPAVPEHADADTRKKLTELRNGIRELIGPNHDPDDLRVQEPLKKALDDYNSGVSALNDSYSPAKEFSKDTVHVDDQGNAYDPGKIPAGVKTTPVNSKTGKPIIDNSDALAAEQKQRDKVQVEQAKQQEKFQADTAAYKKELRATTTRMRSEYVPTKEKPNPPPPESYIEQAKKELSTFDMNEPQPPVQAAPPSQGPAAQQEVDPLDAIFEEDEQQRNALGGPGIPAPGGGRTLRGPGVPGISPLVQTMKDNGAKDPARAAALYESLKSFTGSTAGGVGTYGQGAPSQYTPEARQSILGGSQLPKPQSEEEYNALPSGAAYVYTDGTIKRKP